MGREEREEGREERGEDGEGWEGGGRALHLEPIAKTTRLHRAGVSESYRASATHTHSLLFFFSTISPPLLQFCSDPVSLAIAEAVLTTIEEEGLQENAKRLGTYIMDGLKRLMEKHPCIGDVRWVVVLYTDRKGASGFESISSRMTPASKN